MQAKEQLAQLAATRSQADMDTSKSAGNFGLGTAKSYYMRWRNTREDCLVHTIAMLSRRARVVLQAAELGARELGRQLAEAMAALGGAVKEES